MCTFMYGCVRGGRTALAAFTAHYLAPRSDLGRLHLQFLLDNNSYFNPKKASKCTMLFTHILVIGFDNMEKNKPRPLRQANFTVLDSYLRPTPNFFVKCSNKGRSGMIKNMRIHRNFYIFVFIFSWNMLKSNSSNVKFVWIFEEWRNFSFISAFVLLPVPFYQNKCQVMKTAWHHYAQNLAHYGNFLAQTPNIIQTWFTRFSRCIRNCDKTQPSLEIWKWPAHLQQQYKVVHRMITRVEVVVGTHFVVWVKLHFLIDTGMP